MILEEKFGRTIRFQQQNEGLEEVKRLPLGAESRVEELVSRKVKEAHLEGNGGGEHNMGGLVVDCVEKALDGEIGLELTGEVDSLLLTHAEQIEEDVGSEVRVRTGQGALGESAGGHSVQMHFGIKL